MATGTNGIATHNDLLTKFGGTYFNNTGQCPTKSYIVASGAYRVSGTYGNDQLVKYSDVSENSGITFKSGPFLNVTKVTISAFDSSKKALGNYNLYSDIGSTVFIPSPVHYFKFNAMYTASETGSTLKVSAMTDSGTNITVDANTFYLRSTYWTYGNTYTITARATGGLII